MGRLAPLVVASLVLSAPHAHAGAPRNQQKRPAAPPTITRAPADARYFVRDDDDPRVLHKSPAYLREGLGRDWFEKYARPPIAKEVLDRIEAAGHPMSGPMPERPSPSMLSPALATVLNGDVIVVEGTADLVITGENGLEFVHGYSGLQQIVNRVWSQLGDEYDFISVFTTFSDQSTAAYYLPLQQDTVGLGDCNTDPPAGQPAESFGCEFSQLQEGSVLQGFVFMNSLDSWAQWDRSYDGFAHALDDKDASVYAVLGQEIAHRWVAGLRFVDPRTKTVSKKLLGRDLSHWAAWVDTQASVLDGWDWEVEDDGEFKLVDDMANFSTLDLYAMGALPVAAAKPFFFIDDARYVPISGVVGNQMIPGDAVLQIPSVSYLAEIGVALRATGEQVDLTIQDIVDAEGNRCPDPDHAQKTFRQAVVLVTRPGQTAAQAANDVVELQTVMTTWEDWWSEKTGRALTLCTGLNSECVQAQASLGTSTVDIATGEVFIEPGTAATIRIPASATGDVVRNAVAHVKLTGNGAELAVISKTEIPVGDIAVGETVEVPVKLTVDTTYTCGYSTIVEVSLTSDNAATATERYRVFPGYEELFAATFDDGDDGFQVNPDGKDEVRAGELSRTDVETSCEMTRRTPERDASPGGRGAFVTGVPGDLDGLSSVWSPKAGISLRDTSDPEIRFVYWLDGEPGDSLKVSLSEDDNLYTEALTIEESAHDWTVAVVRIKDVFGGQIPKVLFARFEFEGHGHLEGGLDEVRVLDDAGACEKSVGFFGCSSVPPSGSSTLPALGALLVLGALARRRRTR